MCLPLPRIEIMKHIVILTIILFFIEGAIAESIVRPTQQLGVSSASSKGIGIYGDKIVMEGEKTEYPAEIRIYFKDEFSFNVESVSLIVSKNEETLLRTTLKPSYRDGYSFDISTNFLEFTYIKVCLLYTSPSPRDLSTSRMPSSA